MSCRTDTNCRPGTRSTRLRSSWRPAFRGEPTLKGTIETNATVLFLGKDDRLPLRPVTREEILRVHAAYWRNRKQEEAEQLKRDLVRDQKLLAEHKRRTGESEELFARNDATFRERIERSTTLLARASEDMVSLPQKIEAQISVMPQEQCQSQAVIGPINAHTNTDLQFGPSSTSHPLWTMDGALDRSGQSQVRRAQQRERYENQRHPEK